MFTYGSPRGQKKPNRTNLHRRQKPICFLTLTLLRESVLLSGRRGPDRDAPGTGRAVAPPGSARFYPPLSRAEWSRHWGARDVRVLSRVGCYGCWRTLGGEKMSGDSGFGWTVVVLTCQHKDSVYSFQRGEYPRKRSALIERVIIDEFWPRSDFTSLRGQMCFMRYFFQYLDFLLLESPNKFVWVPCLNSQAGNCWVKVQANCGFYSSNLCMQSEFSTVLADFKAVIVKPAGKLQAVKVTKIRTEKNEGCECEKVMCRRSGLRPSRSRR